MSIAAFVVAILPSVSTCCASAEDLVHVAGYVTKCLLSPDMQKLATVSSDKTIKLWNIDGFTLDRTLTGRFLFAQCTRCPMLQAGLRMPG